MTLTEFLLARVAEDAAAARAAVLPPDHRLSPDDGVWRQEYRDQRVVEGIGITIYDEGGHNVAQAAHIAQWDPARVLAECEAKRRIVEDDVIRFGEAEHGLSIHGRRILGLLALPYAAHPDYQDEWKP